MSLAVQIKNIVAVLLEDGDWHEVRQGSMTVIKYELADESSILVRAGSIPGVSSTALSFKEQAGGRMIACPITSVKAVRYGAEEAPSIVSSSGPLTQRAIPSTVCGMPNR